MPTFLFNEIIFGPVSSRRLGESLGINLLPVNRKICNFNCLYCECGLTFGNLQDKGKLPSRDMVREKLQETLESFLKENRHIDTITFAGNGEPTMHPDFNRIIEDTLDLRTKYYPRARIAVLSNATLLHKEKIRNALKKVDFNILKLDSAREETIRKINCPMGHFSLEGLIANLKTFSNNLTIQTLFVRGSYLDYTFDNASQEEVDAWLGVLEVLKPELVMIYTIARDTPINTVFKVSESDLQRIAKQVEVLGIPVTISG